MVISTIVISVMIIIVKKCKKTQETQQAPMVQLATTNISITTDANMERNPAYVQMDTVVTQHIIV